MKQASLYMSRIDDTLQMSGFVSGKLVLQSRKKERNDRKSPTIYFFLIKYPHELEEQICNAGSAASIFALTLGGPLG